MFDGCVSYTSGRLCANDYVYKVHRHHIASGLFSLGANFPEFQELPRDLRKLCWAVSIFGRFCI